MTEFATGQPEPPRRTVASREQLAERATPDLITEVVNRAKYLGKAEQPAGSSRTGDPGRARDELVEAESVLRDRVRDLEVNTRTGEPSDVPESRR